MAGMRKIISEVTYEAQFSKIEITVIEEALVLWRRGNGVAGADAQHQSAAERVLMAIKEARNSAGDEE